MEVNSEDKDGGRQEPNANEEPPQIVLMNPSDVHDCFQEALEIFTTSALSSIIGPLKIHAPSILLSAKVLWTVLKCIYLDLPIDRFPAGCSVANATIEALKIDTFVAEM